MDIKQKPRVAIVAPVHIQPSEEWTISLWNESIRSGATVIIVDDSDGKVSLPWSGTGTAYDYSKQRTELGDELYKQFERFHKSAACKNFGTWIAYRDGFDVIIVIDSDCVVPKDFVKEHLEAIEKTGNGWTNPLHGSEWYSRGFPYTQRALEKWCHMGLWTETLDLYGSDRVKNPDKAETFTFTEPYVRDAQRFPLSGMNVAFKRDAIPFMLFLPNFTYNTHKFTRHDDIWGGYIFQKIVEQKNKALSYGLPIVRHISEVDAEDDVKAEKPMIKFEDDFYKAIEEAFVFTGTGCKNLSGPEIFSWLSLEIGNNEVFGDLSEPMKFWSRLFS